MQGFLAKEAGNVVPLARDTRLKLGELDRVVWLSDISHDIRDAGVEAAVVPIKVGCGDL